MYQNEPPRETPVPPIELLDLPRTARIDCHEDPNLNRGDVVVWELPGVEPPDPDSAYEGDRGERLGSLSCCTVVTVTDCAWSETDQEFWAYLETQDLEGWVALGLLDFMR